MQWDANWGYIRHSEDIQDVCWTFYARWFMSCVLRVSSSLKIQTTWNLQNFQEHLFLQNTSCGFIWKYQQNCTQRAKFCFGKMFHCQVIICNTNWRKSVLQSSVKFTNQCTFFIRVWYKVYSEVWPIFLKVEQQAQTLQLLHYVVFLDTVLCVTVSTVYIFWMKTSIIWIKLTET